MRHSAVSFLLIYWMALPGARDMLADELPDHVIFTTAQTVSSGLGGLAAMDSRCQAKAQAAGLDGMGVEVETLADRLNDRSTSFLPAEVEGETEMLHLPWIRYVELDPGLLEIEKLDQLGAMRERVTIRLVSGDELSGEVIYILPPERRRLSDLLNAQDWRFLLLAGDDKAYYVNRDAVASVRQR